jgi:hypothetical protein
VRTIGVTLGLSGRAGSQRIRGNVDAGFAAPQSIRLEGKAPFGRPAFILAAAGPVATLYLPRDNRVLREAATASIVEALVGLPLGAAELRALVSGCGFGVIEPASGREYPGGWLAVDGGEGGTTYLREVGGQWRIAAASRASLVVHYEGLGSGPPAALRLQATGTTAADVTARLSDLQINVPLEAAAFAVDVPEGADPLTLDELRRSGPLGDR